ncbi:MAG: class I SAM-dependent methyltransferase [Nannocystaceae bacterium]|nr:class I SAM-dependent methyltransferase [Nannocystaceae bacterium]
MWAEPNDDVIPHLDCPLCHNEDRRFIVGTWEDPIGVARCTACGLVHTTGRHATQPVASAVTGAVRRQCRRSFNLYDRLLHGRLRSPVEGATALDIGCDGGAWLDQMRLWGYRTEGTNTEPTPTSAHHRVYAADADGSTDLGRRYDFVSLIDHLDLVERPAAALHFAARHLAPGGVVIIEVPNWNHGRSRSVLPEGIELGRQVAFYDRDSLRDAVIAVGLEPLATWSAPRLFDRAIATTRAQQSRRTASSFFRRTLALAERALSHASDASDQGSKLVMVAHRVMDGAH